MTLFALCTSTPIVTQRDLYYIARALEPIAREFAATWGLEAPAIETCSSPESLPSFCQPVICTDKDDANTGFLAYHMPDRGHGTLSRAFVPNATGIFEGVASVAESISHEVFEAMVDPRCDLYTHCPGRAANVVTAYECCDAVQDSFAVEFDTKSMQISNYLTPFWFRDDLADADAARRFIEAGGKFDRLGTLTHAGQIGPDGYAVFKNDTDKWLENSSGPIAGSSKPGASHPAARTVRRLAA